MVLYNINNLLIFRRQQNYIIFKFNLSANGHHKIINNLICLFIF